MTKPQSSDDAKHPFYMPSEVGKIMRTGEDEEALLSVVKDYLETLTKEQAQWTCFLRFIDDKTGDNDPGNDINNTVIPCLENVKSKITAILTELDKFPSSAKKHRTYQTLANAGNCLSSCMDCLRTVDTICEQLFRMGCKNISSK